MQAINKKLLIEWVITFILMGIGYFLPLGDIYTPQMQMFVAITIWGLCALAFGLVNNWVIGIVMPVLWIITGVTTFNVAFSGWSSTNFFMLVNAMLFAEILQKTGLMNRIGYILILKSGGTYNSAVWALLLCGIAISLISMMTSPVLIATLALALFKTLNLKPTDKSAIPIFTALVLSATHVSVVAYSALKMGIMNMAIQPVYPGLTISYGMLLKYNWPFIFFIFGFMWLTLKWHEHATKNDSTILDVSAAKQFYKESYEKLGVMTKSEKICLVMLVVLFGWLFAYSFGVLKLDIVYGFILVNTICFLLGIAEEKDVTRLSWGIFAVVMAFVSVGTIATQLQLTNIISSGIASVFSGVGPVIGSFCSLLFGTIANFVLTPYAMMTLLPTVVGSYCVELGWNFLPHLMSTMIASDIIFFPYEYPLVLILFAFGICNMSNTVKLLSVKALVCIAFVAAVMIPYWFVMGLY